MPIDLNSLPLRSRSQGSADFVDRIRLAFPNIQSTAAWRNRPKPDSDSAAQFRYWLGPFINNPNSQLGKELRTLIQQASGRGGEPIEDPHAAQRFGTNNLEFFPEFARQWGLQTPPPSQGQVLQLNERGESSYNPDADMGGGPYISRLSLFGNAIEDITDDVGLLKDPGNAEDDWKSYVKALSLVGGVVGVGMGLQGLMGAGAGATGAGTASGAPLWAPSQAGTTFTSGLGAGVGGVGGAGTMFSSGTSNPSYFTAATSPAAGGTSSGMLTGVGLGGEAPIASPALMEGLSISGGSPSAFGLEAFANMEGGASFPFAGMSSLDLRNLATNLVTQSGGTSSPGIIDRLLDSAGLTRALSQGLGGLVEYFGSKKALDEATDLANELARNAQFTPYNISGPSGSTTFNGTNITSTLSPRAQELEGQIQGLLGQVQGLSGQARGISTGAYNDLGNLNLNDYVNNYVNWARQVAAPYEQRNFEALNSTLLNTGMLGGAAGARQIGEYQRGLNEADLQRLMAGETLGQNRWNSSLNTWQTGANQFNEGAGQFLAGTGQLQNLWQSQLPSVALGLDAGRLRSMAAISGNQYPWTAGQNQAAGQSGLWSNIGTATGNMLGSLFSGNGGVGGGSNGSSGYDVNNWLSNLNRVYT